MSADPPQRVRGEAQPVERAGTHVLEEDVGLRHKLGEDLSACGMLEVQRDGQVVARGGQPERLVPVLDDRPVADGIGDGRGLDLDHLRSVVAQDRGGVGGGDDRAEIDNPDVFERSL
jgi:hypothetical protein